MAEERNQHIMEMERKSFEANEKDQQRGMTYGALLFAGLILSAVITALMGLSPVVPALFLSTAVIGGIGLFIKGRNGS